MVNGRAFEMAAPVKPCPCNCAIGASVHAHLPLGYYACVQLLLFATAVPWCLTVVGSLLAG